MISVHFTAETKKACWVVLKVSILFGLFLNFFWFLKIFIHLIRFLNRRVFLSLLLAYQSIHISFYLNLLSSTRYEYFKQSTSTRSIPTLTVQSREKCSESFLDSYKLQLSNAGDGRVSSAVELGPVHEEFSVAGKDRMGGRTNLQIM